MPGALDEPLEDEPVVARRRRPPRAGRRRSTSASRSGSPHDAHPLAAAAGRRLDEERVADPRRRPRSARRRTGRARRSRRARGRRGSAPAAARPPCRPSAGSRRAAGRPSASPAAITRSAKSAFSARNPNPGWTASAPAASAAATTASASSRSSASGPSVAGATARIPRRSQVRPIRAAISPRLAMNRVRIGPVVPPGSWSPGPCDHERVNRVSRDTPPAADASRRERARSRSSAGRSAWSFRSGRRPGSDSVQSGIAVAIVAERAGDRSHARGLSRSRRPGPTPADASRRTRRSPPGPPVRRAGARWSARCATWPNRGRGRGSRG